MVFIYGIKTFNIPQIQELINNIGLIEMQEQHLPHDMKLGIEFNDIIDFVYYECLPLIPFQVIDAFIFQGKLNLLEKSIKGHLLFVTRMRCEFEWSFYEEPYKSLRRFMSENRMREGKKETTDQEYLRFYGDFMEINNRYNNSYYRVQKNDDYRIPGFQECLYYQTIQTRTENPVFSNAKGNFDNINSLINKLSTSNNHETFANTVSKFILESIYHFKFLKHISQYANATNFNNVESLKGMALFSLLPNVFSRHEFFDVLMDYKDSHLSSVRMADFLKSYLESQRSAPKGLLISNRDKNRESLSGNYSIEGLLGGKFINSIKAQLEYEANRNLEGIVISLAQIIFPIMEMYAYYLLYIIYGEKRLDKKEFTGSYTVTDAENEGSNQVEFSKVDQETFDLLAPLVYKISSIKTFREPLVTKGYVSGLKKFVKYRNGWNVDPSYERTRVLRNFLNTYIISQDIIKQNKLQIDDEYYNMIQTDTILRLLDRYRNNMKQKVD